jgi:leader peptidase (prepilin peptidase)/N-methyltransferase
MDFVEPVLAAAVAFPLGWLAAANQHRLYREEAFAANPATGRRGLAFRIGVALLSAIVAALAFRPDHYAFLPALLTALFGVAFVVLSSTDLERHRIPNRLSYPAMAAGLAVCWAWPDRSELAILVGLGAALAVGAVFFALGLLAGRGAAGLGLGDIKLIILIGILAGWPLLVPAVFLGVLIAGVPAIALLVTGRARQMFAYGPYLSLGALAVLLFPSTFDL